MRRRIALLLLAAISAGCGGLTTSTAPPIPSSDAARQVVAKATELAGAARFADLCAIGAGNCEQILEIAGRDAVPDAPPTVVSIEPRAAVTHPGGRIDTGGQVVTVCGVDGRGRPYRTEMLVFTGDGGRLVVQEPIYWSGYRVASAPTSEGPASQGC